MQFRRYDLPVSAIHSCQATQRHNGDFRNAPDWALLLPSALSKERLQCVTLTIAPPNGITSYYTCGCGECDAAMRYISPI